MLYNVTYLHTCILYICIIKVSLPSHNYGLIFSNVWCIVNFVEDVLKGEDLIVNCWLK